MTWMASQRVNMHDCAHCAVTSLSPLEGLDFSALTLI